MTMDQKSPPRQILISIFLLAFLPYLNIFQNRFLNFDDYGITIYQNPFLKGVNWEQLKLAFSQSTAGYYDPVYALSFAVDYYIWGNNPAGFFFDNLLLHALNSVLLFQTLYIWTRKSSLSAVVAYLFAVHPIHVESVCWISNRADTLSLFLGLISILFYLKGINASLKQCYGYLTGSLLFLVLAMMTRPTMGILPALIFISEGLISREARERNRVIAFQIASWSTILLFAALTVHKAVGMALREVHPLSFAEDVNLFFDLIRYFLKLIFFPINLSALYYMKISNEIELASTLIISLWFGALIFGIWKLVSKFTFLGKKHPSIMLWGFSIFLVGILPFTNYLPRTIYLADRYLYIPSIGFCALLISLAFQIRFPGLKVLLLVLLIIFWSTLTIKRVPVWRDSSTLWLDIESKRSVPDYVKHFNLGKAYAFDNRLEDAVHEYDQAEIERVSDPKTLMAVANTYQTAIRNLQAEQLMARILMKHPNYIKAQTGLLFLYLRAQRFDQFEERLEQFQISFPLEVTQAFKNLIQLVQNKQFEKAEAAYHEINRLINAWETSKQ